MSQYRGVSPQQAILEILSKGRSYGMGIRAVALERMGVDFSAGTLYPALRSLERDGFVSSNEDPDHVGGGKKKVFYELTSKGLRAAASVRRQVLALYESASEAKSGPFVVEWTFGLPEFHRSGYRVDSIEFYSEKDPWTENILSIKIGGSPELLAGMKGSSATLLAHPILLDPNVLIVRGEARSKEDAPSVVLCSTELTWFEPSRRVAPHRSTALMKTSMVLRSTKIVTPD